MPTALLRTAVVLLLASAAHGCTETQPSAGLLGTFTFTATPLSRECQVASVGTGPFTFDATLTLGTDGGAVVTLRGYDRPASWDAQRATTTEAARRTFPDCAACDVLMEETLAVTLFSPSQATTVRGVCPAGNAVPPVSDKARPLALTPTSSDAVLACGSLLTRLDAGSLDGGDCSLCVGCAVQYQLVGQRL